MHRNRKLRVILNRYRYTALGWSAEWSSSRLISWSAIVLNLYKKAVLSQGNRAMPQLLFLV